MREFTTEFAASAVSGRIEGGTEPLGIRSVCSDTRKITEGCLFIALKGERFDGHDYIPDAFAKGAVAAVSERRIENAGGPLILVQDTHNALLDLAEAYRALFPIPAVGVTGSVGKTSTKEMVYAVLSQRYRVHRNEGNLNNEIGMPMSVFGLDENDTAAVYEMGMSAFGEISRLSRVARPCVGIITNIGISHIEKLGSRENIRKAKLEILDGMESGGTMILNGDDDMLWECAGSLPVKTVTYGIRNAGCDITAGEIHTEENGTEFVIHAGKTSARVRIPVAGMHNVYNALAAFAAGGQLGLTGREIADGLTAYRTQGMRQKIVRRGGIVFVEDCYNASPDSMKAAFDVLGGLRVSGRRIAVLADMLELGDHSKAAHELVGKEAYENGVDILLTYGGDAQHYCTGYRQAAGYTGFIPEYFSDKETLASRLACICRLGDAVLFKGSRAMKLEEVISRVYEQLS